VGRKKKLTEKSSRRRKARTVYSSEKHRNRVPKKEGETSGRTLSKKRNRLKGGSPKKRDTKIGEKNKDVVTLGKKRERKGDGKKSRS